MLNDNQLLGVRKPARYIGQEWNVSKKDFAKAGIRFALGFPDLYELGMSNLGIRILYSILNNITDVVCERFFAPDVDLVQLMQENDIGLFSLESAKNIREFDLVGFSLGYELGYTNVLKMLELSGLPLKSNMRDNQYPLVIGGGPCSLNPEPIYDYFDLFVIGEAEEAIIEIVDCYRKNKPAFKGSALSKQDLLKQLAQIEGVYVPSFYDVSYKPDGTLKEFKPNQKGIPLKIKKRIVKDLNAAAFPKDWIVPYIQIVHDRVSLEVMRGCPNRCRFCQARVQYFPLRYRSADKLLGLSCELYNNTGYEEISLLGLSVSDYPQLKEVLTPLIAQFKDKGISISLPSVKPKTILGDMSYLIATIKKTGLTFAPEAANEKLRSILGKNFDDQEFFTVLEQAYKAGYQHVKLYFMIGLPNEKMPDLEAIVNFAQQVSYLRKKINGHSALVNISINTLIPKPHTAFQWLKMENLEDTKIKQDFIRDKCRSGKLKISFHNRQMSFLEGVLSRGDRRLSEVISQAYKDGAMFDAWQEHFDLQKWLDAFKKCNIDPDFYLKEKALNELLPWDFIDTGIEKEILLQENNKIIAS